jgi:LysM domain
MFQPSIPFSPGDSLTKLAHDQLGDGSKWRELADFNGIENIFEKIPIGKNLNIPSAAEIQQMAIAQVQNLIGGNLPGGLGAIAGNLGGLAGGLGDLDLSGIGDGKFHTALMRKLGGGDINQQIKLVDWLY